jgi:hypothetical protein
MSEAEYLDESQECREDIWDLQEMLFGRSTRTILTGRRSNSSQVIDSINLNNLIQIKKERYIKATEAKTGSKIECANCGKSMTKKTYQTKFCKNKCKDQYWNTVDEKRRERTKQFIE